MIKVLIVDDHDLIRKGIILLLERYPEIEIVGEAGDGEEAIRVAMRTNPDVILMDLSMPNGLDGFTSAQEILKQMEHVKIIILTMYDEEVYIQKAIQINAQGFILKNSKASELYEAIVSVYQGKKFYKTGIPEEQLRKLFKFKVKSRSVLSIREKEIVRLTVLGFTNQEISKKLLISPKTVENHKSNIMHKLRLKNKHQLIQYGIKNNYLDLST